MTEAEMHWKSKYEALLIQYINLEEKLYALKTTVALLQNVALEDGKAG